MTVISLLAISSLFFGLSTWAYFLGIGSFILRPIMSLYPLPPFIAIGLGWLFLRRKKQRSGAPQTLTILALVGILSGASFFLAPAIYFLVSLLMGNPGWFGDPSGVPVQT